MTLSAPRKNRNGKRKFTKEDIEKVKLIHHLVKEKGYTLQGAKDKLKSGASEATQDKMETIDTLKEVRSFLVDLKEKME